MTDSIIQRLAEQFKRSGFKSPKPDKNKMLNFCIKYCKYIEKKGKHFFCPRYDCPPEQRKKYRRFLLKLKILNTHKNTLSYYKKIAIKRLTVQKNLIERRYREAISSTKLDVEKAMRKQVDKHIQTLKTIQYRLKMINKTIDRRIIDLEDSKKLVVAKKRIVQSLMKYEAANYRKSINIIDLKIQSAEREMQALQKYIEREQNQLKILDPIIQSRGRKPTTGFDSSKFKEQLQEKINAINNAG